MKGIKIIRYFEILGIGKQGNGSKLIFLLFQLISNIQIKNILQALKCLIMETNLLEFLLRNIGRKILLMNLNYYLLGKQQNVIVKLVNTLSLLLDQVRN